MVRNGRRETLNLGRLAYKQNNIAFMTLKQLSSICIVYYLQFRLNHLRNTILYHPIAQLIISHDSVFVGIDFGGTLSLDAHARRIAAEAMGLGVTGG